MSRKDWALLALAAVLLAVAATHVLGCGYLSDHPPQVCVTADRAMDGGASDASNPGW